MSTSAAAEPYAAFTGFIFSLKNRYTNFMRILKQLGKSIINYFIKSLFDGYECYDMERWSFELPAKYGKLGIINPCKIYDPEYRNIRMLTQEGSQPLKHQHLIDDVNQNKMREMKTDPIE